jgi:hypothetical protein
VSGSLTSADRSLRGRIGAYRLHATHDPRAITKAARKAILQRFEHEVDPTAELPSGERTRRAQMAMRAYMARLAYRSARARRAKSRRLTRGTKAVGPV